MRKSICFLLVMCMIAAGTMAGDNGDKKILNTEIFQSLGESLQWNDSLRSVQNALQNHSLESVFLNREVLKNHNNNYTYEIDTGTVTDQKSTGRCWLYAALNTIRPDMIEALQRDDFEFSTNYYFFYDKLEKANFFLERAVEKASLDIRSLEYQHFIASPAGDGGYWQNAVDLVKKYGVVPLSTMPEVSSNENSRSMNRVLTVLLRKMALEIHGMVAEGKGLSVIREKKMEFLARVYRVLALHLGEPVKEFPYRYYRKTEKGKKVLTPYRMYTPRSFAQQFLPGKLEQFVMLANWPGRPFYRLYKWEASSNCIEGTPLTFVNLPMEVIKSMAVESIRENVPVNFSADVGKQLDRERGIMHPRLYDWSSIYGIPLQMDKKTDSLFRNINSTHAMVFMGVDLKDGEPLKWKVENSWGKDNGHGGYYAMYDEWVDLYVVRVVIAESFLHPRVRRVLSTRPVVIPDTEPEK